MKVEIRDNNLIVFLSNEEVSSVNFSNKRELEIYFKTLFLKLKDYYSIDFSGSYDITVFSDDNYGFVLEIKKDDIEYFDYYDSIDMKIINSRYNGFMYKIIDSFVRKIDGNVYFYDGDFYVEPNDVSFYDLAFLLEHCEIIYGYDCYLIKKNGKRFKYDNIVDKLI